MWCARRTVVCFDGLFVAFELVYRLIDLVLARTEATSGLARWQNTGNTGA